jgi:hypothetical protein
LDHSVTVNPMTDCWGVDSEGKARGVVDSTADIHSIQVCSSLGEDTGRVFRSEREFRDWTQSLRSDQRPNCFYSFTLPYEYGSLSAWDLLGAVDEKDRWPWQRGLDQPVNLFYIKPGRKRIPVYDVRRLLAPLTIEKEEAANLVALANYLSDYYKEDIHKLLSPLGGSPEEGGEFGLRAPTEEEWPYFCKYGIRDAYINAKAGQWIVENVVTGWLKSAIPLENLYSWGTVARYYLNLPEVGYVRYRKPDGRLVIGYENAWQFKILKALTAGRSEAFWTGNVGQAYYNDVVSLYPVSLVHTQGLLICNVVLWEGDRTQLEGPITWQKFYEITGSPYGWILGNFSTSDDLWGLMVGAGDQNWCCTGDNFDGMLYHTLRLDAANADVKRANAVLLPVFSESPAFREAMRLFENLAQRKMGKQYKDEIEKFSIKATMNSATGYVGKSEHGIGLTTNPAAYDTILAESYLLMSQIFHRYHSPKHPIYYTDTDSFFWDEPVEETIAYLEPYPGLPYQILADLPLAIDMKGESRPEGAVIFRGKMYYQSKKSYACSGWKARRGDFVKIVEGKLREADVQVQISKKWKTRRRDVGRLQVGRWQVQNEKYTVIGNAKGQGNLPMLFRADKKRCRPKYNSYELFLIDEHADSRAWTLDELHREMGRNWLWSDAEMDESVDPDEPVISDSY